MNRHLLLVNATGVLVGVSYGIHGPVLPIFAKNVVGASYAELGLVGLATFVPYMFVPLLVGQLLDRFDSGRLLIVGVGINTVAVYMLSVAQSVPELMAFRAMTGVAHAFFWPPCEAVISERSPARDRVRNIARFTGLFVGGFTAGPLLGSLMFEELGYTYRAVFEVSAYVLAAGLASAAALSRSGAGRAAAAWSSAAFRAIFRFPELVAMLLYCTATFGIVLTIFPAFMDDRGIPRLHVEILFFIFGVSRIASLLAAGPLGRRTGATLTAVTASISAALLVSFFAETTAMFAVAVALMGFGYSVFFPITLDIVLARTRREISGSMIGVYETVFGIGWTAGPIAAGVISHAFGNATPYAVFFAIGAGVTAMSVLRRRAIEPRGGANS